MKSLIHKSFLASLALFTLSAIHTDAAVIVTLPTATTAGSIVITQDITFTLTGSVGATAHMEVVFDEWVTSDGGLNSFNSTPITPNTFSFAKNDVLMSSLNITTSNILVDNQANSGAITPNDGFLDFRPGVALTPGDTFTLKAATYTMPAGTTNQNFNLQANQTFTGNAFLASDYFDSGARLSSNVSLGAVPEPSRALLMLGGLSTLAFRRRRVA
jgi:hypothetical protein